MTTGYSPFPQGYDATTAADRFASSYDLERIAATRPDLHAILAANPSIPPQVRAVLERSDDVVVQEVLARQAGRSVPLAGPPVPQAQPAQAQALEQIDAMAPTMAVGTAGAQPPQATPAGSSYGRVPQGYGITHAERSRCAIAGDLDSGGRPSGVWNDGGSIPAEPAPAGSFSGGSAGGAASVGAVPLVALDAVRGSAHGAVARNAARGPSRDAVGPCAGA